MSSNMKRAHCQQVFASLMLRRDISKDLTGFETCQVFASQLVICNGQLVLRSVANHLLQITNY